MEEPPDKKLHYDKYFYINRAKDGKLGFIRNHTAIDAELRQCGFFLIAETDFKKTTAEILQIYRRRDVIEKNFDNLKNGLDMKRLRSHTSQSTQGKIFVSFIALTIQAYMFKQLKAYLQKERIPLRKVLLELDKIKTNQYPGNQPRLLNPPSKTQKMIYEMLELSAPDCIG